jgi:SH3-like domain-containing protein
MVIVGSPYDDFIQVDDGGGTTGWVRQSSVERIASPGS